MASQQDIRRRIRSVQNTRKITKAMELVSAAKLRRAQQRIEALRPFADRMEHLTIEAARRAQVHGEPLLQQRDPGTVAILLVTGDRGLAGAFNSQVVRRGILLQREHEAQGHDVTFLSVGRKGGGSLRFRRLPIEREWHGFSDRPRYQDAEAIALHAAELFAKGEVDLVLMVYNHFINALSQRVDVTELLPIPDREESEDKPEERPRVEGDMLFEPDAQYMIGDLLRTGLETSVYRALLESTASEHGARMTAMGSASKNAGEVIDRLTLAMNRARQAEITQAILEVVAGADALE